LGDLAAAAEYLLCALEMRIQLSMRSEAVRTLFVLGSLHERKGELPQAVLIWQITVELQKTLRDYESIAKTQFELGRSYVLLFDNPNWKNEDKLSVSLSVASFPDNRELKSIQKMQENGGPEKSTLGKDALIRMAQQELEAAIYWDTEIGGKRIAALASRELDALKNKSFNEQSRKHASEKQPLRRNAR
jgi:hypothetical protein